MNALRIAVIGDRESVMGFRALGLDVYPAETDTVKDVFKRVVRAADPGYAIVYLTEELSVPIQTDITALKDDLLPAVILIPSRSGSLGFGMKALDTAVERAIGSNIL